MFKKKKEIKMDSQTTGNHPAERTFTPPWSHSSHESLPGFIKAWGITYIVFAGIWCLVSLLCLAAAILVLCRDCCPMQSILHGFLCCAATALLGGLGLYANILLISKKPRAVPAARCLIILTILHILWFAFESVMEILFLHSQAQYQLVPVLATVCGLITAGRITLLVFYWIAISRAARYFEDRIRRLGF